MKITTNVLLLLLFIFRNEAYQLPQLTNIFAIDLEITYLFNLTQISATSLVDFNYDQIRNQIAATILSEGNSQFVIIDFNSSQIFNFYQRENDLLCKTEKCSYQPDSICRDELNGLFPQLGQRNLSLSHVFNRMEIFAIFPSSQSQFFGSGVYQNIQVDKWLSVDNSMQTTTTYWTDVNWKTPIKSTWGPIPILSWVKININNSIQIVPNHYKPTRTSDAHLFQPPEGTYCNNWLSTKQFPTKFPTNAFKFSSDGISDIVTSWSNEWFDLENGLIRIDYQTKNELLPVTKVIDITTDVVFVIINGQCSLSKLQDMATDMMDSPTIITNGFQSGGLSHLFGNANYSYIGNRKTREISSLVWQSLETDQINGWNVRGVREWYFQNNNQSIAIRTSFKVTDVEKVSSNNMDSPLKKGQQIIHQIYAFQFMSSEKINPGSFDVAICYDAQQIYHLQFEVNSQSAKAKMIVSKLQFQFKWRKLLAQVGKIPLLRVTQVKSFIRNSKIMIQFKLLDVHSEMPPTETNALQNIRNAINGGDLKVQWIEDLQTLTFTAVGNSLSNATVQECPTVQPTTFKPTTILPTNNERIRNRSKGTAAGVGVGCFMIGLSSGLTAAYILRFKIFTYIRTQ